MHGGPSDHTSPSVLAPPSHPPFPVVPAGTGQHKLEDKKEVVRLVETLALGSVGQSTQIFY